jgi:hypothetical protein
VYVVCSFGVLETDWGSTRHPYEERVLPVVLHIRLGCLVSWLSGLSLQDSVSSRALSTDFIFCGFLRRFVR